MSKTAGYLAFLLLLVAAFSLGCGSTSSAAPPSNSPSGNGAVGQLVATPSGLNFGTVLTGSKATLTVTLSNPGTGTVTVSSASMSGSGFSVAGLTTPLALAPGQASSFAVSYAPSSAGIVTGSVSLVNTSASSPLNVSLSGTGATPAGHWVDLSWTASTSTVSGYNVYRATSSDGPYTNMNPALLISTDYTDSTVSSGTTYYYVVTAIDRSGAESGYSNQVQALIPNP